MGDIAGRLRLLADRLETEWRKLPALPKPAASEYREEKLHRTRLAWSAAVDAGQLLLDAIAKGAFADDAAVRPIVAAMGVPGDDGHRNAVFLALSQQWLPARRPGYRYSRAGLGYAYADAMRVFADELSPKPAGGPDPGAATVGGTALGYLVTLQQAAAMVKKSKSTLEKRARKRPMPLPEVEGGGGKTAEWEWSKLRPWLETEFSRSLPEQFPSERFIRR